MTFTISDTTPRSQYTAAGGQTVFAVPFEYRAKADVKVLVDGVLATLSIDYTMTDPEVSGGGSITFTLAPGVNKIVLIYRDMPVARTSDQYSAGGQLPAIALEASFDDVTMKMQQLEQAFNQTSRVPITETLSGSDMQWPVKSARLGKFARWDSVAGKFEPADISATYTTLTRSLVGAVFYPQTEAEVAASVTPSDYSYPAGNVLRYGANGDGATDNTTSIQNAINVAAVTGVSAGAFVYAPAGIYKGNWTIKTGVFIVGDGASTKFIPTINDAVFKTPSGVATVRIGWEDCFIYGDAAMNVQDGIFLSAVSGGFAVDGITLNRVRIENCGRYGLRGAGAALATTYIQRLELNQCNFLNNVNCGLSLTGKVLETLILDTFVVKNGGAAGANANCEITLNSAGANRVIWIGGGLNAFTSLTAGVAQTALLLNHAQQVTLIGVDLESASPFIKANGNLSQNLSIIGCNFGTTLALTGPTAISSFIQLDDGIGITIDNCRFDTTAGAGATSGIATTTAARVQKLVITETNSFSTLITTPIDTVDTTTIATGVIFAYRNTLRVDVEGGVAASDDLDSIYDGNGGTSVRDLIDDQQIRLSTQNSGRDVVVKHATGNILVNGAVDFTLLTVDKFIILQWNVKRAKWFEVGRCA